MSLSKFLFNLQIHLGILLHTLCDAHAAPIFKNIRVLTLYNINKFQTGCFVFMVNKSLVIKFYWNVLKNMNIHDYNTKNKLVFHVIHHSLLVRQQTITIYGVQL